MAKRPSLHGYRSVIVFKNYLLDYGYHTAVIVAMRKAFGRSAAWSAYGYGYRQYEAVAVDASLQDVKAVIKGKKWAKLVKAKRFK